jgi:hypothetical protein
VDPESGLIFLTPSDLFGVVEPLSDLIFLIPSLLEGFFAFSSLGDPLELLSCLIFLIFFTSFGEFFVGDFSEFFVGDFSEFSDECLRKRNITF